MHGVSLAKAWPSPPQGRYLVMQSDSPMTAFQEIVIGGYIVPEPATMGLLLMGD
jgi:hypothetical protein